MGSVEKVANQFPTESLWVSDHCGWFSDHFGWIVLSDFLRLGSELLASLMMLYLVLLA